jgi:hypothetical protein
VIGFAQGAFLYVIVDEVAVGMIAGVDVLFEGD